MNHLLSVLLFISTIPVEFRILFILVIFLSLSAFFMSLFSVFLFYKFYRDTIRPIPLFLFSNSEKGISLKLLNNGHSAFYIHKFFASKNGKISETIGEFLPLIHNESLYSSFSTSIEGRKVMPDQSIKIFELDFEFLGSYIKPEEIDDLIRSLNDIIFEVHCHDIGKRYKSIARESISI